MERPNIFIHRDYRELLREFYEWRKANEKGFSYRKFSQEAGLTSPNYLKLVIDGDRNLSLSKANEFAQALGFDREETAFFGLLVRFGNAKDSEEKSQLFRIVEGHRRAEGSVENLDAYQAYFSHWAYPVLVQLLTLEVPQDPKSLAKALKPSIPTAEVRKALDVLEELGHISRDASGKYTVAESVMETPLEIKNVWMRQYHTRVLERAIASLDEVEQKDRNISTFGVTLPQSAVPEFMEQVHRLRRELFRYALELSENSPDDDDRIYQLAIQAFPVAIVDEAGE